MDVEISPLIMSNLNRLVEGYPRLAGQMGQYPETGILRRFAALNSQNLLYLQAELVHLEERLRELEAAAAQEQGGNQFLYAKDWYWLKSSAHGEKSELWEAVLETKMKIREYNNALLQQVALSALPEPSSYNLQTLQQWLEAKHLGNLALIGEDQKIWGSTSEPHSHASDLIAIRSHPVMDAFSRWVAEKALICFHHRFWHRVKKLSDLESGVAVYEDNDLLRYTSHTTTAIASLLPVISVIILSRVQDAGIRLGLTALFTFLLGFCLAIFTNAQRREVFTAVAAFSAVQVVFISGNGHPTATPQ